MIQSNDLLFLLFKNNFETLNLSYFYFLIWLVLTRIIEFQI